MTTQRKITRPRSDAPSNPLLDVMRFGPAPTPGRELIAAILNLAIAGVVVVLLHDDNPTSAVVIASVVVAYVVGRFAWGARTWTRERA